MARRYEQGSPAPTGTAQTRGISETTTVDIDSLKSLPIRCHDGEPAIQLRDDFGFREACWSEIRSVFYGGNISIATYPVMFVARASSIPKRP